MTIDLPLLSDNECSLIEANYNRIILSDSEIQFDCRCKIVEVNEQTGLEEERIVNHSFRHLKKFVTGVDVYWGHIGKIWLLKIKLTGVSDDWVISVENKQVATNTADRIMEWLKNE